MTSIGGNDRVIGWHRLPATSLHHLMEFVRTAHPVQGALLPLPVKRLNDFGRDGGLNDRLKGVVLSGQTAVNC